MSEPDIGKQDPAPPLTPHAVPARDVAVALDVDPAVGLAPDEVARRRAAGGANELARTKPPTPLGLLLEAALEPFVVLLAVAGVLAVLVGEVRDGVLVLLGLVPIVGADVLTEYRGERALAALRAASAPRARLRRAGRIVDIAAADVVVGDVVLIRVGDVVPADLRLSVADRLAIDRAVLTGESLPETAAVEPDPADAPLIDRRSMAYAGGSVVAGRGEGIVVAIGGATEVGAIASGLGGRTRRRSPLQRELDRLVRILLVIAIGLIAITTGLGFARGNSLGANVLAGISAAIAAIPEEPPVLLAVILGLGAYRLLKRGVLVRRLNAEEVLGAVDLVITDKTGTLTQNRLAVAEVVGPHGEIEVGARRMELLGDALRAEDDAWTGQAGAGRSSFTESIARAIEDGGGRSDLDPADLIEATPFEATRPFTSTTSHREGHVLGLAIGAPEAVVELTVGQDQELTASWRGQIVAHAGLGRRLVGLARRLDDGPWEMRAVLAFADPIRPGIAEAVAAARAAGIQIVVVTGDHPATAAAIAREAGLDADHVTLGAEIDGWTDPELAEALPSLRIVARSTPDQKRRLVAVARGAGRLVAVTGDGVNDAPALHAADVAVAMGSGTAVAREASDLVLGDDSFATLVFGMREGRRIVDNVQKGLVFLTSTHVALLGFILVATLLGYGQPLLPIQILWLELFIDMATSVAFEREPPEPDVMTRPPRPVTRPLLTWALLARVTLAGGFSVAGALALLMLDPAGLGHGQWLAYTTLACAQAVRGYTNRSLNLPLWKLGRNGFLLAACAFVVVVQVAMPAIPALADAFRAVPLRADEWILVAIVALAPAALAEAVRAVAHRAWVA